MHCSLSLYFCVCSGWTHGASSCSHPCPPQNPLPSQHQRVWGRGEAWGRLPVWTEVTHRRFWVKCIPWFPALCQSDSSLLSSFRSCGCKSCISDPGKSDWFSLRYDPKQQPILLGTNNKFDPDALKWWQVRPTVQSLQKLRFLFPLEKVLKSRRLIQAAVWLRGLQNKSFFRQESWSKLYVYFIIVN